MDARGGLALPVPYRIVALQLATSLVAAAGFALVDTSQASAALVAGAVCVPPAGYYAWVVTNERSPHRLLVQGLFKFLATVVLMGVAFAWWRPAALGFFSVFALMQLMYVVAPLIGHDSR